jgi:hypothetical protein
MFIKLFYQRWVYLVKKCTKQFRGCPITLFNTNIGIETVLFLAIDTNDAFIFYVHVSNNLHKTLWDLKFHSHIFPQCSTINPIIGFIKVYKNKP